MSTGFAVQSYSPTHASAGSFASFGKKLQGRNKDSRKLSNNTYAERRGENIAIRLHATDIITISPDDTITVKTGGWQTPTTKARLNEFLPAGFSLWANKGIWQWANGQPFTEGDQIVSENGIFTLKAQIKQTAKELQALRKNILKYAKGFAAVCPVDTPGHGDCFYCQFVTEEGKTLGEASGNTEHFLNHIEENYYVPSLLNTAIKAFPLSPIAQQCLFKGHGDARYLKSFPSVRKDITSSVARYLYRQFNLPS